MRSGVIEIDLPSSDELSAFDPEEQLATRAAWLYFVGSNTQAEIGKKLGLTRVRINRLLALARVGEPLTAEGCDLIFQPRPVGASRQ